MSDEKNLTPEGAEQTEDIITERKIRTVPQVHTVKGDRGVHIPQGSPASSPEQTTRRFIKTGDTPFLSVRAEKAEAETATEVTKFSDRLSTQAAEERIHTGFTGKMHTYDTVHAVSENGGRMIDAALEEEQIRFDVPDGDVKRASPALFSSPAAESEEGAPTKHIGRGDLLREIAGTADEDVRRNPDQLMMEGFDKVGIKTEEEVRSEEALLEELSKTRERKIGDFRFWGKKHDGGEGGTQDETYGRIRVSRALPAFLEKISERFSHLETPFAPVNTEEYTEYTRRREGFEALKKARLVTLIRIAVLAALGLFLLILDAAAKGTAAKNDGFFTVFGGSVNALVGVNIGVFVLSLAVTLPELKNGLFSILKMHPRTEAALLLLDVCVLTQNVIAFFTQLKVAGDIQLLTPAAVLLAVPLLLSKLFYYDNTRQCFKSVATRGEKSYLRTVSDPALNSRLTGSDANEEQKVVYVGRTRFVSGFFARSANASASAFPSGRIIALSSFLSLVTGIIAWIIGKNVLYGVSAAALCLSFAFPVCCLVSTGFFLSKKNQALSLKSSFIGSFYDAGDLSGVENIAADADEIFSAEITGCLTSKGVSEKQARFVAASLANQAGSLIKKSFSQDISNFEDKLPAVESLVYEEKLGLSAWVNGCKILLGAHDLLVNHSVPVPEENLVIKFLREGEKPLYLAIEGQFTAVFSVVYSCPEEVKKGIKSLVEGGTILSLSTTDANITDRFAEALLELPEESVRMISAAAAAGIKTSKAAVSEKEDPGAVFTDSFVSLCRVADAAVTLDRIRAVSKVVCAAGAFVSLALGMVLVFTGAYKNISALSVLLMQCVLIALCFLSPFMTGFSFGKGQKAKKPEAGEAAGAPADDPAPDDAGGAGAGETPAGDPAPAAPQKSEPQPDGALTEDTFDRFLDADAPAADVPDEAPAEEEEEKDAAIISSESLKKTFASIGGFFSKLTEREKQTEEAQPKNFSLFGEKKQDVTRAEDIESAYEKRRREEKSLRAAFTAPAVPDAPVYDLRRARLPEEEKEAPAFVPPAPAGNVDLFDDALWSRFEDDKVFAGLHEDEEKLKYEF